MKECGVVDCSEAGKVLDEVKRQGLKLVAVLPTHYHFDHVGGNEDLARAVPGLRVYGARGENGRIPAQTDEVDDGGTVKVGSLKGRVIGIPAHTNGHVAYYFPQLDAVFTGDTLVYRGMRPGVRGQGEDDGRFAQRSWPSCPIRPRSIADTSTRRRICTSR